MESQVEKLYENAGVKKITIKGCYEYYAENGGIDIYKTNDCKNKDCNICKANKSIQEYPPFTAEKQIELIKWISDTDYYIHNIYKTIDTKEYCIENDFYDIQTNKFEETLARLINKLWQDLTEQEKEQIRDILKG